MRDLIFAYGSNMNHRQMAMRCPGARVVCVARLRNHRLTFAGTSPRWGGGVATICPARRSNVHGIIWELNEADLMRLDAFEGYPFVYDRTAVKVDVDGTEFWCSTYVKEHAEEETPPSANYLQVILDGYKWAEIPIPQRLRSLYGKAVHLVAA